MTVFEQHLLLNEKFELSEAFAAVAVLRREAQHVLRVDQWVNRQLAELRMEELGERERRIRAAVRRAIG